MISALAGVLWLIGVPGIASSQGNTWAGISLTQMVKAAKWRVGALRVNGALEFNNVGYDSDIYYGYFDEPVADFTLAAAMPVQILLPVGKKIVLDVFDSPQYIFYLDTKGERSWNNAVKGQVHIAMENFYIQIGGGLSNVRQRLSPELNLNIRQKEDRINGTLLWQASQGLSFALLYGGAKYDYGDAEIEGIPIAQTLNRNESYVDAITYVQPSSRVRLFLDGQFGDYFFTEAASRFKDTRSYGVFGGLTFIPQEGKQRPIAPLQGSIRLGYKSFDIIDPLVADGSGFVGAVDISAGMFKRTTCRGFFSQDFSFSAFSTGTFYLSTAYGGGLSRQLSRRAILSYDLTFSRSRYPGTGGEGAPSGRNFRYTTHLAGLHIMLARHVSLSLLATIATRTLDQAARKINRNFFGINLIYGSAPSTVSAPAGGMSR